MKKRFFLVVVVISAALAAGAVQAGQYDKIVSAADVEKATGLIGVKQVPRDKAAPGYTENKLLTGDLNFVNKDGQPILLIQFRPAFIFEKFKSDGDYFKAAVPGVGGAAFSSPNYPPQYTVNFVQGNHYAVVSTRLDPRDKNKTILTFDQVVAVAKLVASRM